jgi:hypothetical protein
MPRAHIYTFALAAIVVLAVVQQGTRSSGDREEAIAGQDPDLHRPPTPDLLVTSNASLPPPAPLRAHADDVADYTIRARLDPSAHAVHGSGTIRFRNTSDVPVHELWLHLYLNAFKNERSTFLREPVAGFRGSATLRDWGTIDLTTLSLRDPGGDPAAAADLLPDMRRELTGKEAGDDETDARVPLPREVRPGETITLDVTWDDKLPSILERTGYSGSFHFVGQWFPKLARLEPNGAWAHFPFHHLAEFYADFGTYDVTLDVPDTFTIGATGPVVETHREGGRKVERHVQSDVHDFAWTAWDHFRTREETIAGTRVRVLYPEGYDRDAETELAAIRFALPYLSQRYGAYPYPTLTVVHPPDAASEAGGMEYPTLITTGGAWYGAPFTRLIELVTVHELGHQWFYGLLASNEELWPFLDEGVNSYAEADTLRAMFGPGSAGSGLGLTVSDDAVQAVVAGVAEHTEPVAQPAYAFATGAHYAALVYDRTATILETLRRVYGDQAMDRTMAAYTGTFRFEHPGPEDLIKAFNAGMGGEAAAMLRRALFDEGWVDYAVTEVSSHAVSAPRGIFDEDGKRQTVAETPASVGDYEGWVLVERRGTLRFPVLVELTFADGSRQRVPWDGEASSVRLPYRGRLKLVGAVIDPDHAVLLDDDLTNNHASAAGVESVGANRVFERATYWAELLAEELGP